MIVYFSLRKIYTFILKNANTCVTNDSVILRSLRKFVWNHISLNYLLDVDLVLCFIVISFQMHPIPHHCVINRHKSRVIIANMLLIASLMLKLTISLTAAVFTFNFLHILLVIMFLNGYYWNTWMIVSNYLCFSNHVFGHNFPKHRPMSNSKLGILLSRCRFE